MAVRHFLLDTNIVSDLVRHPQGLVATHIARVGEESVCTSIIVACELRYGAAKRGSARLTEQLEAVLVVLPVLPLEPHADREYGLLRSALERQGETIGPNDLLIASQALAAGLTLVTENTREFKRVPGLNIVNWLEGRSAKRTKPPSVQERTAKYTIRRRRGAPTACRTRVGKHQRKEDYR